MAPKAAESPGEKLADAAASLIGAFAEGVKLLTQAPGFLLNVGKDAWALTQDLWDKLVQGDPKDLAIYSGIVVPKELTDEKAIEKYLVEKRMEILQKELEKLRQDADFMRKYRESALLLTTIKIMEEQKRPKMIMLDQLKAKKKSISARVDQAQTLGPGTAVWTYRPGMSAVEIMMAKRSAAAGSNVELVTIDQDIAKLEKEINLIYPWSAYSYDVGTNTLNPVGAAKETNLLDRFNQIAMDVDYQNKLVNLKLYLSEYQKNLSRLNSLNRPLATGGGSKFDKVRNPNPAPSGGGRAVPGVTPPAAPGSAPSGPAKCGPRGRALGICK